MKRREKKRREEKRREEKRREEKRREEKRSCMFGIIPNSVQAPIKLIMLG